MDPLTERQAEILRLIRELTEVSGFPPTRAEIARSMGFRSVNAAEQHLRALEKKGAIEIMSGASRGIRVLDSRPSARLGRLMELPVIGRVAAGSPMLAEAHLQGRYQLDPNLFTPRADYLLKVRGMSMRDAGISTEICSRCTARTRRARGRSSSRASPTKSP
jgi:repressor LexA